MLKPGFIVDSGAEDNPNILVPKPNSTWQFCNDYRKLNEISKYDAYPMLRINKVIEQRGVRLAG